MRTIDLFCGAGGCSWGAQNAGATVVAGFDAWEPAIKTFSENFPKSRTYSSDIRTLSPEYIRSEIGDIDLILASPECTNHSNARGSTKTDEDSRETALEVARFARAFMPHWIVIENVIQIQRWRRYNEIISGFRQLGYHVRDDAVLNAKDFGVPQSRERLFILCSQSDVPALPPIREQQPIPVSSIVDWSDQYPFSPLKKKGRAEATIQRAERAISALGSDVPFLLVYYGSDKSGMGGWQPLDQPLRTVTTLDRFALVIPDSGDHKMRMLQPEELKLAMGYDFGFKLGDIEGLTRRDRVKLMGNGVCPPVMEAIVNSFRRQGATDDSP
jgi:DNA (cytosine-5)-methyltransferase 1